MKHTTTKNGLIVCSSSFTITIYSDMKSINGLYTNLQVMIIAYKCFVTITI